MDLSKFLAAGMAAQEAVDKILIAERAGLQAARDPWGAVPSAHAPVSDLIAEIDRAVVVLRKAAAGSPSLAYAAGYLEGFRELLASSTDAPRRPLCHVCGRPPGQGGDGDKITKGCTCPGGGVW